MKFSITIPFLLLTIFSQAQPRKNTNKKPNILFCIADDASLAHMHAYGLTDWVNTPGFDRVAKEAIIGYR